MSLLNDLLMPGDFVFHPKYGFGTVHSLTRRDRVRPIHEPTSAEAESDGTEDYYDIHLKQGATLLVPVSGAASVGPRRLTAGVEMVEAALRSPAQSLPASFRERATVLKMREQVAEHAWLVHSVRDILPTVAAALCPKGKRNGSISRANASALRQRWSITSARLRPRLPYVRSCAS